MAKRCLDRVEGIFRQGLFWLHKDRLGELDTADEEYLYEKGKAVTKKWLAQEAGMTEYKFIQALDNVNDDFIDCLKARLTHLAEKETSDEC